MSGCFSEQSWDRITSKFKLQINILNLHKSWFLFSDYLFRLCNDPMLRLIKRLSVAVAAVWKLSWQAPLRPSRPLGVVKEEPSCLFTTTTGPSVLHVCQSSLLGAFFKAKKKRKKIFCIILAPTRRDNLSSLWFSPATRLDDDIDRWFVGHDGVGLLRKFNSCNVDSGS